MDEIELNTSYRYDGEDTTTIPTDSVKDYGGMYIVECPDGSTRSFSKEEVVEVRD